jgi:hypothetical protein
MPMMQDSISVAANSVSSNVLAGQLYEFVRAGQPVRLSGTGSAAGLRVTLLIGMAIINDQALNLQNRFPLIPDDVIHTGRSPVNGRMVLTFRNTTAGALTSFWRVDL